VYKRQILDDDPPPSLWIDSVGVAEGEEGTSVATFTLSLSAPSGRVVGVTAATADGTATAGTDYAPRVWTVAIPPGEVGATLAVGIHGDRVWEEDETFFVNLSAPMNALLGGAQGVGTIQNDDAPGFSVANLGVVEPVSGTRTAAFTVTLSPPGSSLTTVDYSTQDGTATAGSDYDATSGTLSFDPGVSGVPLNVTVHADALAEYSEEFQVTLSDAAGAAIAYGQATGRIYDPGSFFTLTPCRVLDTRDAAGPYGGPALAADQSRAFTLAGRCGIPATAHTVSVNLTVTQATARGNLRLYPADRPVPGTSTLNYTSGVTRANNAVAGLSASGALAVRCTQATGTAHIILDVNGYFE